MDNEEFKKWWDDYDINEGGRSDVTVMQLMSDAWKYATANAEKQTRDDVIDDLKTFQAKHAHNHGIYDGIGAAICHLKQRDGL